MIKSRVKEIVDACFAEGIRQGFWTEGAEGRYSIEVPKREEQGDFATNFAMVAAGIDKRKPRELAARMAELLSRESIMARVDIAGPGFINLFLEKDIWASVLAPIHEED